MYHISTQIVHLLRQWWLMALLWWSRTLIQIWSPWYAIACLVRSNNYNAPHCGLYPSSFYFFSFTSCCCLQHRFETPSGEKLSCMSVRNTYRYVCMYVCMYVCTYVCMYVWMYVCMYVCTYVCMYVCMYVRTYVRTYVRMYVCMYVCT